MKLRANVFAWFSSSALILLLTGTAWMANYPDVVAKSFEFTGPGARGMAQFLGLDELSKEGPKDRLFFTQSEDYQRQASEAFWSKKRRPDGSIEGGNFVMPTYNVIQWDRISEGLFISGLWLDHDTGSHTVGLLRYEFTAPLGKSTLAKEVPPYVGAMGWDVLIERLRGIQGSNTRHSERKSFKVRPLVSTDARWSDRLWSHLPWADNTIEFRVDFNAKNQVEYARISVGPWRNGRAGSGASGAVDDR